MQKNSIIQCYDPINECEISRIQEKADFEKCLGIPVECCDLDLVNDLYSPYNQPKNQVPLHIKKKENGNYEICPDEVYKKCYQEDDFNLCITSKCNDLGYLEPDNQYQVCKALGTLENKNLPDCSSRNCRQVVNLQPIAQIIPNQSRTNSHQRCSDYSNKIFEEKGFTLGKLFNYFPDDENFFRKGTILIIIIILIILLIIWWLGPRNDQSLLMNSFKGSSLYDEYLGNLS